MMDTIVSSFKYIRDRLNSLTVMITAYDKVIQDITDSFMISHLYGAYGESFL